MALIFVKICERDKDKFKTPMLQFFETYNEKYVVEDVHKISIVFKTSKENLMQV